MRSGYRPTRGQLTLAFVNAEAYSNWDPSSPGTTRFVDEDMNRVWTHEQLDSRTDESSDLERARALRPFYDRVDHLLDIHSMGGNHAPIMLCHGDQKQRAFAAQVRAARANILWARCSIQRFHSCWALAIFLRKHRYTKLLTQLLMTSAASSVATAPKGPL